MHYTSRIGDRPGQAHINYKCPCGCEAGLTYDRDQGSEHLGMCCCGRLLWVGGDAQAVVRAAFKAGRDYQLDEATVHLPWGGDAVAVLAEPLDALALEQAKRDAGKTPTKVVDPVCHMMFDPESAAGSSKHQGTTYYFCALGCKHKFEADPAKYVGSRSLFDRMRGR